MKRNRLLILACFALIVSCAVSQNKIKRIKLEYVSFDSETDAHVDCKTFEEDFKDQVKHRNIDNTSVLDRFAHYLDSAHIDKKNSNPDVRAKIYIYNNDGTVDTLCIGKFALRLNNRSIIINDNFINFVKQLEGKR